MPELPEANGPILRSPTVKQQVLALVRGQIERGERAPGTVISAKGLADELKVSRTPVREAMEALVESGVLEKFGNEGARIRKVDDASTFEILALRRAIDIEVAVQLSLVFDADKARELDGLLAEMEELRMAMEVGASDGGRLEEGAAGRERFYALDTKFHRMLPALAGMSRAEALIDNLMQHYRLSALPGLDPRSAGEVVKEHRSIVQAIKGKGVEEISNAVTAHYVGTVRRRIPAYARRVETQWMLPQDRPKTSGGPRRRGSGGP